MSLRLLSPPVDEPVTLNDLKQHLRIANEFEDAAIEAFGKAARQTIETRIGICFLSQRWTWRVTLEAGELTAFTPFSPLAHVETISQVDRAAETVLLVDQDYSVVTGSPGEICFHRSTPILDAPVTYEIVFSAGYSSIVDIPAALIQALLMLTAHFYENRESASERRVYSIPEAIDALLTPYRQVRI